jgi:Spy/CpxP family protein refolding chaperone
MGIRMNRRRWLGFSLLGVVSAGALGALLVAPARGGPYGHGGWWRHGRGPVSEERIRAHVEWMLRGIDVSGEQLDRIAAIAARTQGELRELRGEHGRARGELLAALTGPTVDRAALEALRARHVAAADAASRKLTEALAEAAEVLTPEQRAQLAAQHAKLHAGEDAD